MVSNAKLFTNSVHLKSREIYENIEVCEKWLACRAWYILSDFQHLEFLERNCNCGDVFANLNWQLPRLFNTVKKKIKIKQNRSLSRENQGKP